MSLVDCNGLVHFTLEAFGLVSVCGRWRGHGDSESGIVSCFGLALDEVYEHAEWGEDDLMLTFCLRAVEHPLLL